MTDDELRALVREAVARHLGGRHLDVGHAGVGGASAPIALLRQHASHYRYELASGDEGDGPCLIEPAVRCNHCGYCQSHGH
jgi:hypothetical protein